ncbi:uncharacterized protein AKAME5_001621200 [Lates japonicus]|uniref:Uncharacterized protein n=1 Tax=Lates japonicus TaxID=270547 RepID=A0AAD3RDP5_LATJO|nr:uncharacterized protein AKAME5_001621200 [Lates japonicus]
MDEATPLKPPTVAEMLHRRANAGQNTDTPSSTRRESNPNQQHPQHHLPPVMTNPTQPQTQAHQNPLNINFLPGVHPPPLSFQTLSTAAGFHPEFRPLRLPGFMLTPCSNQGTCWMNMSSVPSTPSSMFLQCPCAVVPHGPFLPPPPCFPLPDVHHSCYLCPQAVPVHQPCAPGPLTRGEGEPVSEQLNASPKPAESEEEERNEEAESEEKQQSNDKDKLQANNTEDETTKFTVSPGCLPFLDEQSLAKHTLEEYMAIMDSICPKTNENVEVKENDEENKDGEREKQEAENTSFLEYLDKLCSDEDFVRNVESKLDIDFLNLLLSDDPEPPDLLAWLQADLGLEQEPPNQSSVDSTVDPVTDTGTFQVGLTLNRDHLDSLLPPESLNFFAPEEQEQKLGSTLRTKNLDSPISPDPGPLDFIPLKELQQEAFEVTLQEQLHQLSADSNSDPVTDETPKVTVPVEERAQTPVCFTSLLEATDQDALAALLFADDISPYVSEDASVSLSNFVMTQSIESLQRIQSGPLPVDPPASESNTTSSVAGPHAIARNDPAPSFRAASLTDSPPESASPPPLTVLARKTLGSAQIRETEQQCSPRNINPKSTSLKDTFHPTKDDLNDAIPVPASSSVVADSHSDSCDDQVDGNSSGLVPKIQMLEAPKGLQVSQELVSPGIVSEILTREWRDIEKTEVTKKKTATKAREEGVTEMSFEKTEENKESDTKLNDKIRRSQRLSDQNEKEKAGVDSEFKTKRAERKPNKKSIKKTAKFTPEKDGVLYEKPSRQPSGGRQLCKREESNFEERSQGAKITHTVKQLEEKHQNLTEEIEKLKVEAEEQCETDDSNFYTKTPQKKSKRDEGRVKRQEEPIQTSSFLKRRTRRLTAEEKVQLTPLPAANNANKNNSPVFPPVLSSPQSPDTPLTKDTIKVDQGGQEAPGEALLNERHELKLPVSSPESPSVKTSEENPTLPLVLQTENTTGIHKDMRAKATCRSSSPRPSPHQTTDVKGEGEEEHPSLPLSPMKRHRQECGASEETEMRVNETEKQGIEAEILKSPMKRARWKNKAEVNSRRAEEQEQTQMDDGVERSTGKDETFAVRTPNTRSKTRAEMISDPSKSTGQESEKNPSKTPSKEESGAMKTRSQSLGGIQVPRFPCKRQTLSAKLPTKYKDFTSNKPKLMGQKRQLNREKGKAKTQKRHLN